MMKNKKHLIPLFLTVAVLIGVLLFSLLRGCESEPNRGRMTVDENAVDIGEGMPHGEASASDSISIPGFERMTVPAGENTVPCNIFNPENNHCYFVAVISLEDGRELYHSGLIPPGKAIYTLTLSDALATGLYNAVLSYHCYSLDESQTELNGATTHFILEVLQ